MMTGTSPIQACSMDSLRPESPQRIMNRSPPCQAEASQGCHSRSLHSAQAGKRRIEWKAGRLSD